MAPNLAVLLAQHQAEPGEPLNVLMRRANDIFKANAGSERQPFPTVEVVFATFLDYLRDSCNQRERDLVVVSELLYRVWGTVHGAVQTLGQAPTQTDQEELERLAPALARLGFLHLLTEGLREDLQEWVIHSAEAPTAG